MFKNYRSIFTSLTTQSLSQQFFIVSFWPPFEFQAQPSSSIPWPFSFSHTFQSAERQIHKRRQSAIRACIWLSRKVHRPQAGLFIL